MNKRVKVWDLPIRLFHWSLVSLLGGLWWTASEGEMEWHMILGFGLGSLLMFRIVWGLIGSDTARFSHFLQTPKDVLQYAATLPENGIKPHFGHNPLGGYMVIILLLTLTVQFVTGLFATDEVFVEGPLYSYVSTDVADWMTWLHKQNVNWLLFLIALHLLAVAIHLIKGDSLLKPMLSGSRRDIVSQSARFSPAWLAWVLVAGIGGVSGYFLIWPVYSAL
ncbi:cytochrome b/b6 domain-containing protein [Shewanella sp. GXUN23E]|uniref:cytochrome b/b6 domain-containing protein n=1 Tax=Shewanella sp. GXUN23E TaxID=3422498 RepID=UPI003D7D0678